MSTALRSLKRTLFEALPWRLWGPVFSGATGAYARPRSFRRNRVGAGSYIDPSVQIVGCDHVRIGRNSVLCERSWLNVNHRAEAVDRIVIGDGCHIGRSNFLSAGPSIVINDFCLVGLECRFLGCGHDVASPVMPYIASGLTAGAPIRLGVNCWLATSVTVLEGVCIGHGSIIGTRSLVTRDVPPFSTAFGTPCRVVRRFDFRSNRWIDAAAWQDDMEPFMPTEEQYRESLRSRFGDMPAALIPASRRFGWL
jgi:acetyltransferase-like isoleucine patch superfamily enzyme